MFQNSSKVDNDKIGTNLNLGNNLPKWWTEQKQYPISFHLLSISTNDNVSSSEGKIQPLKIKVQILNFHIENCTLLEFVENTSYRVIRQNIFLLNEQGLGLAEVLNPSNFSSMVVVVVVD